MGISDLCSRCHTNLSRGEVRTWVESDSGLISLLADWLMNPIAESGAVYGNGWLTRCSTAIGWTLPSWFTSAAAPECAKECSLYAHDLALGRPKVFTA